MTCGIKIVGTVLLLALLGADVGLQTVRVLGGAPLPIQAQEEVSPRTSRLTDTIQALSAAFVAIFTAGLLCVGWQQSRILKEQHDISKRQAAIAERLQAPVVSVSIETPGIEVSFATPPHYRPGRLEYCLSNHSQAPVFLMAVEEQFHVLIKGGGLPPPFSPNDPAIRPMSYGVIVPPNGKSQKMTRNLFSILLSPEQDAFYTTNGSLFLTMFARFEDIFSDRWIMGLCYIYDDVAQTWVLAGGSRNHNYCRREIEIATKT
jgi:hypothetical protein